MLCAALGALSRATYRDLGGSDGNGLGERVERAGALLSLLTKIDDQIIDARPFHGLGDRGDLRDRTRAYLAPTLASLRAARPVNDEPRCALAAELGASLRALASSAARLDHVIALIAEGWEVQVEAVSVLTSHPALVSWAEVASITRRISGMWLLMIAAIGSLPEGVRALTPEEERAFGDFGWAIQRADAFADLGKDLADGHLSSWPGKMLYERAGSAYLRAADEGDIAGVYRLAREHGVDRDGLPGDEDLDALSRLLPDLGETRGLLLWIFHHLAGRYMVDPRAQSAEEQPCLAP